MKKHIHRTNGNEMQIILSRILSITCNGFDESMQKKKKTIARNTQQSNNPLAKRTTQLRLIFSMLSNLNYLSN